MNKIVNIVTKGEIACYECFRMLSAANASESVCMWERVNYITTPRTSQLFGKTDVWSTGVRKPRNTLVEELIWFNIIENGVKFQLINQSINLRQNGWSRVLWNYTYEKARRSLYCSQIKQDAPFTATWPLHTDIET